MHCATSCEKIKISVAGDLVMCPQVYIHMHISAFPYKKNINKTVFEIN